MVVFLDYSEMVWLAGEISSAREAEGGEELIQKLDVSHNEDPVRGKALGEETKGEGLPLLSQKPPAPKALPGIEVRDGHGAVIPLLLQIGKHLLPIGEPTHGHRRLPSRRCLKVSARLPPHGYRS